MLVILNRFRGNVRGSELGNEFYGAGEKRLMLASITTKEKSNSLLARTGRPYLEELLKVGGGVHQLRHNLNGSVSLTMCDRL